MRKKSVAVDDLMQKGYVYFLAEPTGRNFRPDFHPQPALPEIWASVQKVSRLYKKSVQLLVTMQFEI